LFIRPNRVNETEADEVDPIHSILIRGRRRKGGEGYERRGVDRLGRGVGIGRGDDDIRGALFSDLGGRRRVLRVEETSDVEASPATGALGAHSLLIGLLADAE
jgi:hypothetical protein